MSGIHKNDLWNMTKVISEELMFHKRLIENGAKTWCDLITTFFKKASWNSIGATCFRGVKVFQVVTHFVNRHLDVRELQIGNANLSNIYI